MGADIFSKFDSGTPLAVYKNCQNGVSFEGHLPLGKRIPWTSFASFEEGPVRREWIKTPFGALTHTWEYLVETGAPFESEHWWKSYDEYPVIRYWLLDTEWHLDEKALLTGLAKIGDDGALIFQLMPSPLKQFHWLAGQVNASYFVNDHPEEMCELARIWERKSLEYLEEVVDLDGVWVFEVADDLDTLFYPPRWFKQFCVPVFQKQAEMIHSRGKYLFVHACGRLKALGPLFLEGPIGLRRGTGAASYRGLVSSRDASLERALDRLRRYGCARAGINWPGRAE